MNYCPLGFVRVRPPGCPRQPKSPEAAEAAAAAAAEAGEDGHHPHPHQHHLQPQPQPQHPADVEYSKHMKYLRRLRRHATMSDAHSIKMAEEQQQQQQQQHEKERDLKRSNSIGANDEYRRPQLQHRNSWPTNTDSTATSPQPHSPRGQVSPRGPMKSHIAKVKEEALEEVTENHKPDFKYEGYPEPAKQRQIVESIDTECTCTYSVSKIWYRKWEEHVGVPNGLAPGESEKPGPIEMDSHNDANNEYVNEDIWRHLVYWYGVSPSHQLDRKHLYFKDEKMFDVCVLSPFSGIVEHNVKKFNRFEEVGYIECQLRRIFHIDDHKKTRLWISEKAQVPRFRQLLLRFRMLNDCIHRDKVYILALEECVTNDAWSTGEPGEPKGDLNKYKDIICGPKNDEYWDEIITKSLTSLQLSVSDTIRQNCETFLKNSKTMMCDKASLMEECKKTLEVKLEAAKVKEELLEDKSRELAKQEKDIVAQAEQLKKDREEFVAKEAKFTEELERMESLHGIQETKIKLDIGGGIYTTSIQTLKRDPDSMLAAMFSGRYELKKEPDGSYFIDRDGTYFRYILNFLRDGHIDAGTLPNDVVVIKELLREAKYYQLSGLVAYLNDLLPPNAVNGNGN